MRYFLFYTHLEVSVLFIRDEIMPVGDDLNVVRVLKRKADIDSVVIHISVDNEDIMIIQRFENA